MSVSIAIALSIMALTIGLIEKRKSVVIVTRNKPVISSNKAPDEALVRATASTFNQKITNNPKSNETEQKTLTTQNHASVILELERMHPNYKVNSRTQTPSNTWKI